MLQIGMKAAKAANKVIWKLNKNKPQILVGGGIVIATGAFVLAIVNARKIDETAASGNQKVEEPSPLNQHIFPHCNPPNLKILIFSAKSFRG